MAPAVSFGSQEFLALPKGQQNELIFSLLAPLARYRVVTYQRTDIQPTGLFSQVGSLAELRGQQNELIFSLLAPLASYRAVTY